ncbi:Regulator of telomere elongation helicase 1 [Dichanthelium oligosanthes]|uniref:Regulator of telomere elongation helicase 1 n=1 Tax=Dichanthelium oligosanthes TaxID=888268 RepID=A0A1E5WG71_9POAL|nr:Regulator of telomere elongation helicase 1 [Dichanthelium oligosanthes]
MPVYSIRGVDVDFPFDAYDCQITYMDRVIESLQQGKNALLESPTGTGKTLCLLCASLAWRRTFGEFLRGGRGGGGGGGRGSQVSHYGSQLSGSQQSGDPASQQQHSRYPVIIYASRTHSQLRQVIKELKATSYRPKMAVLGSREQMCIHGEVNKLRGRAQNNACHFLCKKRRCQHNNLVAEFMKNKPELGCEPFDIEDLVNIGKGKPNGPCPYYISRELSKSVDILFAPYNYLIDPGNRRSLNGIPWDNAFHVNEAQQTSGDALKVLGKSSRTLSWWCFNPGLAMEEFLKLGVRSIILTSGTLSPLDSLAMELNLEFPVRLENPHVISQDQIWVGVVPVGPSGHALNSSYRTLNFARIVPDGLLVFFPSYSMMDKTIQIQRLRTRFGNESDYAAKLHDSSTSGAIFFAVCRGKVSEGLDFADRAGRAVIVTGMPFATPTDPKVRLKREYLDKQGTPSNKNTKEMNGIYNKQQGLSIRLLDVLSDIAMTMELLFIVTKDCIAPATNECMPRENLLDLAASARNECPQITLSVNSTTRRSNFMKLAQITPANRSTLTTKHNSTSTSQLFSEDQLSQDTKFVDMTDDVAVHGHLKEYTFKSLGLKKAKLMDRSKDAVGSDDVSPKLPQNMESRALARYQCEGSTPQSKKSTTEKACGKNEATCEKSEGQESNPGAAFLKLAREKLSGAEYREFVEFMKALKLKTMHIKDSLEAIGKLFSSPERLPLLEGFRVFVPKNHLPLYEQLVRRYRVCST